MSTVSKLEIRGIRSFGVDSVDVQKINFTTPLTLIVGQNGCGKTTVIECLKYGLTGELPPGTNRGIGFVHDPKIFSTVESLGQVKLMVKDVSGNSVTAIRSMKTTQKGKLPKFETLDSTIVLENCKTKEKTQMTRSRAVDVNNEMCDAMGVSKAILNNVIFCHQEDSCWPLEEPKVLKNRFDAIFGTTEYNRLIDKLIKSSKELGDRQKEKLGDLKLLKELKAQAELKRIQLEDAIRKHDALQQKIGDLATDIEPIVEKLENLARIEREYSSLVGKRIDLRSKIQSKDDEQRKLKSKIKHQFAGSLVELEGELRMFQQKTITKQDELEVEKSELESTKAKERSIQSNLQRLDGQKMTMSAKRNHEHELKVDRGKKMEELGRKLNLSLPSECSNPSIDENIVVSILDSIRDATKKEEKNVQTMAAQCDEEDVKKQKEIDKLRESKATLESDCVSKKKQIQQMDREKMNTEKEVATIELSAKTLEKLNEEIAMLEQEYEKQASTTNLPALRTELAAKKQLIKELQEQSDNLEERIHVMEEFAMKEKELAMKEQQYNGRESEVRRLRNKHADSLRRLFPERTIESNYKRNLQDLYDSMQREVTGTNEKIRRSEGVITEMETLRKTQKQQLDRLTREQADAEEKMYSACRGMPYDEVVARLKEKIDKNTLEHGEARSAVVLFQKYINNISTGHCCPVCDKELTPDDAQDVSGKLSDEIRRLPQKIESLEKGLKSDRLEYDKLLSLKSVAEMLDKQKQELPKVKQQLQETERRFAQASEELEELQIALSEPTSTVQLINSIVGDMSILDENTRELERMKRGVEQLKEELQAQIPPGVSTEALKAQRESLREQLKQERRLSDELQGKLDSKADKLNNLQSRNNEMKAKKLKLQESVQSLAQKREKVLELADKICSLETDLAETQCRLEPMKRELDQKVTEKLNAKQRSSQQLQKARKTLEGLNQNESEIERLCNELDKLASLNLSSELQRLQDKIDQAKSDRERTQRIIEQHTENIERMKQDIANHHIQERDLLDNRDLKMLMRESSNLQEELNALMKSMGEIDYSSVNEERTRLINLRDGLQIKQSELKGQIQELKLQIKGLQEGLEQGKFKDATRNYMKTFCESVALRKIISDVKKYRDALERALREYHTEKMEVINRTILSLWRAIYRGNDIDYIRIRTEDDANAAERSDRRRLYSYGVVQAKNDVEIEMRGRCSAGQRVLASLIIRLALSETFCSNCGVMALDEPTTNLDRENIESLCESLRRIVAERENANFLLIVITHDEEFVTKLEKFETYYRISRNHEGKSVIKEERV
ncbi:DNA repair protein RAD50-like [Anopheles albimanus]|uniref:DNA repair protein RAD50 n=1 Tax=Anopheles albimanus TaxID=7167 RepID=A0A182FWD2_ANOAL|nr:DNA repair protein RAD50-like [Anopheles albimanus]XP_035775419.1 DNA repair protein RAD50-like [Anopheles albimanus]